MSNPEKSRSKIFIFYLLTFSLVGIFIYGCGEFYYRVVRGLANPPGGAVFMDLDEQMGWLTPGKSYGVQPDPEAFRIAFLGDSFTQPADKPGHFIDLYNQHLARCSDTFQTQNLGVAGFGQVQEYVMWEKHGKPFKPHVTFLMMFMWNDIGDNLNDIYYSYDLNINRPEYDEKSGKILNNSDKVLLPRWLTKHSILGRHIEDFISYRLSMLYWDIYQFQDFYRTPLTARMRKGMERTEGILLKIRDSVERSGSRFVLVAFDNPFSVEKLVRDYLLARGEGFEQLDLDLPMRWISQWAAQQGIDFLHLDQIFKAHRETTDEHIYAPSLSGHFTPLGQTLTADALMDFSLQKKLFSCP
jgi:hypothetical protein